MSDTKQANMKRRDVLKTMGAGAAFTIVPRYVLGGPGYTAPSDTLNIAMVGTGGQGLHNLKAVLPNDDVQIIAIADVTREADYSHSYHKILGGRKPGYELISAH